MRRSYLYQGVRKAHHLDFIVGTRWMAYYTFGPSKCMVRLHLRHGAIVHLPATPEWFSLRFPCKFGMPL